jgi:hypothetical protein|tara:strand:- start:186 stop:416 length:231 start_codon:yes stop_codon:yes gene_type:complete
LAVLLLVTPSQAGQEPMLLGQRLSEYALSMREDVNLVETGPKNSELLQSINDKLNEDAFIQTAIEKSTLSMNEFLS